MKTQDSFASLVLDTTVKITAKIKTSLLERFVSKNIYLKIIYLGKIRSYLGFEKQVWLVSLTCQS